MALAPGATLRWRRRAAAAVPWLVTLLALALLWPFEPAAQAAARMDRDLLAEAHQWSWWAALAAGLAALGAAAADPAITSSRAWRGATSLVPLAAFLAATPLALLAAFGVGGRRDEVLSFALPLMIPAIIAAGVALRVRPGISASRLLVSACAAVVAPGALACRIGPGISFLCNGPSLGGEWTVDGLVSSLGVRAWPLLFAAIGMGAAAFRERGGLRVILGATAGSLGLAALRDGVVLVAAASFRAAMRWPHSDDADSSLSTLDLGWLDGLARLEAAVQLGGGVVLGAAILAVLGVSRRDGRARTVVAAFLAPTIVLGWMAGSVSDPPPFIYSTFELAEPVWSAPAIDPLVFPAGSRFGSVPAYDRDTWVLDAAGRVATIRPGVHRHWELDDRRLQILPDRRVPLRTILETAARSGATEVSILGRTASAARIETATAATSRFLFAHAATRTAAEVDLDVAADRAALDARMWGIPPCLGRVSWRGGAASVVGCDDDDGSRWATLEEIPEDASVAALLELQSEDVRVIYVGSAGPAQDLPAPVPSKRGRALSFHPAPLWLYGAVVGLVGAAFCALAAVLAGWRRRVRGGRLVERSTSAEAPVLPPWLPSSACDAHIVEVAHPTYRGAPPRVLGRTARRLLPALAASARPALLALWNRGRLVPPLLLFSLLVAVRVFGALLCY